MSDERYLVRASEIETMQGLEKRHFLNQGARRVNKSLGDRTGLTGIGFHVIEVAPGDRSTELHLHHHEDECVYVLCGTATAIIGEDTFEIGPGDFIGYRKGGRPHVIENTGTETLRCIVVGERLAHDVVDYPQVRKRLFRNKGLPWNVVDFDDIEAPDK